MKSVSTFGVVVFTLALLGNRTTEPYKGHTSFLFSCHFSCDFHYQHNTNRRRSTCACLIHQLPLQGVLVFFLPTSSTVAVAMKICSIFLLAAICTTSRGVLPHYLPATRGNALAQDKLIETYINLGFAAQETVLFLASVRGLCFILKHLKRILRRLGCRRRRFHSDLDEKVQVVQGELRGSGSLLGYRAMHQRLVNHYGLVTTRDLVRHVLKVFDTEGVEHRSRHRLRRRVYRRL